MGEFTYDPHFLHSFCFFDIIEIQIDDKLILADNNFASVKENTIKSPKIIIKNREILSLVPPLKLNSA